MSFPNLIFSVSEFFLKNIVTPDPNYVPTTSPLVLVKNQQNCTCVPYHMCDPQTNTVIQPVNDDDVTGFGKIDIRFNDQECVDVLDVCCVGAAQREESITPPTKEGTITKEAGCGVRNVNGIDFQITGAVVSLDY